MRLADVLLSHYGKVLQVPVSYPILLRRALLITQLPKVLLCQMNHNARALSDFGVGRKRRKVGGVKSRGLPFAGDIAGLESRLRFRVPILDLNQIKCPRAQPIVQVGQALLQSSRSGAGQLSKQGVVCRYESGDRRAGEGGGGLIGF